jgi:RNA-binding protein YlmH
MDNYFNKKISTILSDCYDRNKSYVTNFLSISEQEILTNLAKRYPTLSITFDGGIKNAEYAKCIISPFDAEIDNLISILKISFNPKYLTLTHRILLGVLMHLGISRDRVGDIVIEDSFAYVTVDKQLVKFIKENLTEINHQPLNVEETFESVMIADSGVEKTIFLQSNRLDAIIAQSFNISREDATELIKREMVKINQKIVVKSFQTLSVCDIISLAKKGRIKLLDDTNSTRSCRIVMKVKIYR